MNDNNAMSMQVITVGSMTGPIDAGNVPDKREMLEGCALQLAGAIMEREMAKLKQETIAADAKAREIRLESEAFAHGWGTMLSFRGRKMVRRVADFVDSLIGGDWLKTLLGGK